MKKEDTRISVFATINDETLAEHPSDIIFCIQGANYFFNKMDGDEIVIQPCTSIGHPISTLPRLKVDKSSLKAESYRLRDELRPSE